MNLPRKAIPYEEEISAAMSTWYRKYLTVKLSKSDRIDVSVMFALEQVDFWLSSDFKLKIQDHFSNGDIKLIIEAISEGSVFLMKNSICPLCGSDTRSWNHNCVTCPKLERQVNIQRMFQSNEGLREEGEILLQIIKDHVHAIKSQMTGHHVKLVVNDISCPSGFNIKKYFVTKRYDDGMYRCREAVSGVTFPIDLDKEKKRGNMFIAM